MSHTQLRASAYNLEPGTRIDDRYEIIRLLGRGGFAQVFEARQLNIDRLVALKILFRFPDPSTQATYEERFLREARVAAQIRHPNVVTIHDFGVCGGMPYIAMELLSGHDLATELKQHGPMPASRALPLFLKCLDALGRGHEQGIVHKDLKPANLHLHEAGRRGESLRVLDFGIARLADSPQITQSQQLMGTPRYYAPEYAQHQIATPALDVYQMGLILVEALMGAPVVAQTDPMECLLTHCSATLEIPRRLLESPLGPVLARALEVDHTRRYADAHALLDALAAIDPASVPQVRADEPRSMLHEVFPASSRRSPPPVAAARPASRPVEPGESLTVDSAELMREGRTTPMPLRMGARLPGAALQAPQRRRWPFALGAVVVLVGLLSAIGLYLGLTGGEAPVVDAPREVQAVLPAAPPASAAPSPSVVEPPAEEEAPVEQPPPGGVAASKEPASAALRSAASPRRGRGDAAPTSRASGSSREKGGAALPMLPSLRKKTP